jgi:hypothetical protein
MRTKGKFGMVAVEVSLNLREHGITKELPNIPATRGLFV